MPLSLAGMASFLSCFTPKVKQPQAAGDEDQPFSDRKAKEAEGAHNLSELPAPTSNGGAPIGTADMANGHDVSDAAREKDQKPQPQPAAAKPTVMAELSKPVRTKPTKRFDPSQRFVRELPCHPEYR